MSASNPSTRELYVKEYLKNMHEICDKNFTNIRSHDKNKLVTGIFYANEYYHALKETKCTARLEFLIKRDAFYNGWANPKMFNQLINNTSPSGKAINSWVKKAEISPSIALQALKEGPTLVGCGEVLGISEYLALQKNLGEKKFDFLFSSDSPFAMNICPNQPIEKTLRIMRPFQKPEDLEIGDSAYILGVPELYQSKHMNGEAQAYNVLCCENQEKPRFLAFGIDPKQGRGVTAKKITNILLEELNKVPETMELFTQELAGRILATYSPQALLQNESLRNFRLTKEQFTAMGGGRIFNQRLSMDYDKLSLLVEKSPEEGLKLMKIWTNK